MATQTASGLYCARILSRLPGQDGSAPTFCVPKGRVCLLRYGSLLPKIRTALAGVLRTTSLARIQRKKGKENRKRDSRQSNLQNPPPKGPCYLGKKLRTTTTAPRSFFFKSTSLFIFMFHVSIIFVLLFPQENLRAGASICLITSFERRQRGEGPGKAKNKSTKRSTTVYCGITAGSAQGRQPTNHISAHYKPRRSQQSPTLDHTCHAGFAPLA